MEVLDRTDTKEKMLNLQLKTESLWILTNLTQSQIISKKLVTQFGISTIIQGLMLEHFMKSSSKAKSGHGSLSEQELRLFDVMLELSYNLACDFPTLFFSDGYATHILSMTDFIHE